MFFRELLLFSPYALRRSFFRLSAFFCCGDFLRPIGLQVLRRVAQNRNSSATLTTLPALAPRADTLRREGPRSSRQHVFPQGKGSRTRVEAEREFAEGRPLPVGPT